MTRWTGGTEFEQDRPIVTRGRPDPILSRISFNFDGAATLLTVSCLARACFPLAIV